MGLAILLVEDDRSFAKSLSGFLRKEGHEVEHVETGEDGIKLFSEERPDLLLLDLVLPGISGLQALEELRKLDDSATVIVMTGHGSIETAVEAMRLGATDYIAKPVNLEALSLKLDQAGELLGLSSDTNHDVDGEQRGTGFEYFIGNCPEMRAVYDKIREVAKTDNTTVLVTGQSGTGKELVARSIHSLSSRRNKPLMQIDCTAIPLSLMESELLGHERGAFTGADSIKKGLLELADGGTLFLDEIGDMDPTLQSKLLRVLQERQFRRVGGALDLRFDVRVIAATNQDLDRLSDDGRFRRDLLYRLKVFQIELPPLRDRGKDILALAEAFVSEYTREFRKQISGFDADAKNALAEYSFPGNVRELRNIVEQAVILAKGELITRDLLSMQEPSDGNNVQAEEAGGGFSLDALGDTPLQTAERKLIALALERTEGNKKRAAELLGISRFALQRKLEKMMLDLLESERK